VQTSSFHCYCTLFKYVHRMLAIFTFALLFVAFLCKTDRDFLVFLGVIFCEHLLNVDVSSVSIEMSV